MKYSRLLQGQNRSQGSPSKKKSSSDWKATATNRMHSNDLKACEKCFYFWFHFGRAFDIFLDLVILPYFYAISIDLYAV